jgi:hypothetical protein
MPALAGLSLRQALEVLSPLDVQVEVEGRGIVTAQSPAAGAPLESGAVCRITLASPVKPAPPAPRAQPRLAVAATVASTAKVLAPAARP